MKNLKIDIENKIFLSLFHLKTEHIENSDKPSGIECQSLQKKMKIFEMSNKIFGRIAKPVIF